MKVSILGINLIFLFKTRLKIDWNFVQLTANKSFEIIDHKLNFYIKS
jgi:hypothetical protein